MWQQGSKTFKRTQGVQADRVKAIAENDVKTNKKGGTGRGQQYGVLANFTGMVGVYARNGETAKTRQRTRQPDADGSKETAKRRKRMRKPDVDGGGKTAKRRKKKEKSDADGSGKAANRS